MGKGVIISGGEDGQYQVQLKLHTDRIEALIIALTRQIAMLESMIETMEDGSAKEVAVLKKVAMEKRKEYLQGVDVPEDPVVDAWCADLTEDLSGDVGMIEIPGERGSVNIQPGYNGNAAFNSSRDGQLQPAIAGTPAGVFYNLAMLPGWQKWKPTYRFGTITSIDGDTCTVSLEAAVSSQQNMNINQATTLYNVPIEYMTCNGAAFNEGDGVIVEFEGQDWDSPKVIGFDAEPKPCTVKCSLIENADLEDELAETLIPTLTHGYTPEEEGVDVSLDAFWLANVLSLGGTVSANQVSPPTFNWPFVVNNYAQVKLSLPSESFEPGWYHITYQAYMRIPTLMTESDVEPLDLGNFVSLNAELLCGLEIADVKDDDLLAFKLYHYGNGSRWEWRQMGDSEEWTFLGYENDECGNDFTLNYTACVELTSPEDIITFRIKALCYAYLTYASYWFDLSYSFSDFTLSVTNLSVKKIKMDVENDGPWRTHDSDESLIVNPPISPATKSIF